MHDRPTAPLVALPLVALVAAVLIGVAIGAMASAVAEPAGLAPAQADATEDELVLISSMLTAGEIARATGVLVGVGVAHLVWFIGIAWTVHRYFPQGRRARPAGLAVGAAWLGSALTLLLLAAIRDTPPDLLEGAAVAVVVAALAGLLLPVWARRSDPSADDVVAPAQPVDAIDGWLTRDS